MNTQLRSCARRLLPALLPALVCAACASIGNPSGGARDEDPPRFVRSNPAPGSTGVSRQKIDIEFDELVNVKDAFTNVIVSPPSASVPRVSSLGRRVSVQFADTLLPNTTYTIDFGSSIEDNNEGNKLQGFAYSFSTGPVLDSLMVSGVVLGSLDEEPRPGLLVGVHSNLADTAFTRTRFERVARTDDRGRFTIRGLAPGTYSVFALGDTDNDYTYANPEEEAAFLDFTVSPTTERVETQDTVWNLATGVVDTVVTRMRTRFLPNDLLLRTFISDRKPQYLVKYERPDSARLSFIFNSMAKDLPQIGIAGRDDLGDWYTLERSAHNDTLTYWLTDRSVIDSDTLHVSLSYLRTGSDQVLAEHTDTLRMLTPRSRAAKKEGKKKKISEADSIAAVKRLITLPVTVGKGSTQEVWQPLSIEFGAPLARLDTAAFHLEQKVDTTWVPVRKPWALERADSLSPRRFVIDYAWDYDTQYALRVDTLAATGIYGRVAMPQRQEFKTRSEDDYSSLTFHITGFTDTVPAFVELLNQSDAPVRAAQVEGDGTVVFRYLQPGKYYARIYEDLNGNGRYDTGDYETGRQPDQAYYYPKQINLKKNWDKSESWDVFATAVDMQKPDKLKKNKPDSDKRRRNAKNNSDADEEEEESGLDPFAMPLPSAQRR